MTVTMVRGVVLSPGVVASIDFLELACVCVEADDESDGGLLAGATVVPLRFSGDVSDVARV